MRSFCERGPEPFTRFIRFMKNQINYLYWLEVRYPFRGFLNAKFTDWMGSNDFADTTNEKAEAKDWLKSARRRAKSEGKKRSRQYRIVRRPTE